MKLAFIDDEPAQSLVLKDMILAWEQKTGQACEITVFESGEAFLFEHPDNYPYDLLLLDIQMKGLSGIELAKRIREKDEKIMLAFLTNCGEYVFAGYEVLAARYLMKPLEEEKIFELLDYAGSRSRKEKQYFICSAQGETVRVDVEEIAFAEAQKHYVRMLLKDGRELVVKYNFTDLVQELPEDRYVLAHRSYLVNLGCVERITKTECLLNDGGSIPVSRSKYKALNEAFICYYRGGMRV